MARELILKNSSLSGRLSICRGAQCVLSGRLILTFEILDQSCVGRFVGNRNLILALRIPVVVVFGFEKRKPLDRPPKPGRPGSVRGVRWGNTLLIFDGFAPAIRDGFWREPEPANPVSGTESAGVCGGRNLEREHYYRKESTARLRLTSGRLGDPQSMVSTGHRATILPPTPRPRGCLGASTGRPKKSKIKN
jgi:hypothetical protein